MGTLLALASAACYGIADLAGGLLSRRANVAVVAVIGQAAGLVLLLPIALVLPARPALGDLGWGALSGVGTGIGMLFLYRGLRRGAMSVVVPVSAVGGLAIPVLVGVALFGDRPFMLSALGIGVVLPALWLVSRTGAARGPVAEGATLDALVASVGISVQYLALAPAGPQSGIWPVVAGRLTAALTVASLLRQPPRLPPRLFLGSALTGGCAALALVSYLLATQQQLVTIAVVLSSLYPVIPVLLGLTVLHERLTRRQVLGLFATGVAIVLLTAG